ncbi:MAG: RDD family protein [Clostridia bacterium]|nr:RDD family protein [Clostridia bacterium]
MSDKIRRLLAALIDFYIICFISSALVGIITLWKFNVSYFSVITYLIACFLLMLFKDYALKNKSPGKRIFKIKVAKTDGSNPQFWDFFKRSVPAVFLLPVEVLLLIINNRRIGDIWAGTSVVRDLKTPDGSMPSTSSS